MQKDLDSGGVFDVFNEFGSSTGFVAAAVEARATWLKN
jgi:hypothetical protein